MSGNINHVSIIEILRFIYRNILYLISIGIIGVITIIALSYLLDEYYKSSSTLLPNTHRDVAMSTLGQGSGLQSLTGSVLGGGQTEMDKFIILLDSKNLKRSVVREFNLTEVYNTTESTTPVIDAMTTLNSNLNYYATEEGAFVINVWDKNPERAHRINKFIIDRLNKLNIEVSNKGAREYRKFIEKRYREAQNKLASARDSLAQLQQKHDFLEFDSQAQSYIKLLGNIYTGKVQKDIEFQTIKKRTTENNKSYQNILDEKNALTDKFTELLNNKDNSRLLFEYENLPAIGKKYMKIRQDLKVYSKISEFIVPIYEKAKLEEKKSLPLVSVVDEPSLPQKDDWPQRLYIAIGALFSIILLEIFYVLVYLTIKKNKDLLQLIK